MWRIVFIPQNEQIAYLTEQSTHWAEGKPLSETAARRWCVGMEYKFVRVETK